jgi:hypothetical protein
MSSPIQTNETRVKYFYIRDEARRPVATVAYRLDYSGGASVSASYGVATCAMDGSWGEANDYPKRTRGREIAAARLMCRGSRFVRYSATNENAIEAILSAIAHAPRGPKPIFPKRTQDLALRALEARLQAQACT